MAAPTQEKLRPANDQDWKQSAPGRPAARRSLAATTDPFLDQLTESKRLAVVDRADLQSQSTTRSSSYRRTGDEGCTRHRLSAHGAP